MMAAIKLVYFANVIVAGWIGITSLFFPRTALRTIFENTLAYSKSIRLVGALWFSIFVLSSLGLFFPLKMSPVLLVQLVYKSTWLLVVCIPAVFGNNPYPKGMALFFIIWVFVLPFVIPWKVIFEN